MKLVRDKRMVPVLMFHSVGLNTHSWVWSHLSEPVATFEKKIALLSKKGFHSIFWDDLYNYMGGRKSLSKNSIMLTFDDGYLDNWVFVHPILKRYGFKATIFVTPDFVDPAQIPRPTLEDIWAGRCKMDDFQTAGFLSWAEMRKMEASGVIDIQSHALTHTWYFSGPAIVDYHSPHYPSPYPWLFWNKRPERKPFYITENQQEFLPWGYPVLEHQKSLIARRFFPDDKAADLFTRYVESGGGREFFAGDAWCQKLMNYAHSEFGAPHVPGTYESVEDRSARIRRELEESKRLLEGHLGKRVDYICWPGGGNDPEVQAVAKDLGYKAWTLGSKDKNSKRNLPGSDPTSITRMATSNSIKIKAHSFGTAGPAYQIAHIEAHRGSRWAQLQLRGYQILAMTGMVER